ncbi:MAG: protein phosphatase [Planctomycetia bacterium]|nr:protein phosphatase [Planctomycetia bacterium]
MSTPQGFSWVERPGLAALAQPRSLEDLLWLREQGIGVLVTLTEDRLRRDWVDEAGLLAFHEPLIDMEAPTAVQLDRSVSAITKAREQGFAVAVHCGAGLGRTGVVLAAYLTGQGMTAAAAIARIRKLRPHSIETVEQERAVEDYAQRQQHHRL